MQLIGVGLDGVRKEKNANRSRIKSLEDVLKALDDEISALQEELTSVTQKRDKTYEMRNELFKSRDEGVCTSFQYSYTVFVILESRIYFLFGFWTRSIFYNSIETCCL